MTWPFNKNQASKQAIVLDGNNQGILVNGSINGSINGNIIQGSGSTGEHQLTQLHIPWDSKPDPALIPSMLHWKSRIPPQLIGRDADMAEMLQWAQSDFPLKMRLIHAQGGMGKTRFAFELAEQLKQLGWKAGQMLQPDARVAYEVGEKGLLLIIDYPEQQDNALATLVKQLARMEIPDTLKLRILLLSRRDKLAELPGELDYRYDPPYELAPLSPSNQETDYAWQLFKSALQTMQHQQKGHQTDPQLPLTESQFKQWLEQNPNHSRPLFILAYALHLLYQPEQLNLTGAEIIKQLVERESRRLREEANSKDMDADGIMLLKALAGITGGINASVLTNLQTTPNPEVALPPLRNLSQSSLWDQQSQSMSPLQPDLLAAQLLQNELDKDYLSAGKWLYQSLIESDKSRQREAIDRLGRLIFDYHYTLKSQQPESSSEKNDLIAALVQTIEANQERCQTLKTIVDMDLTQPLLPLAITVNIQMIETCEDQEEQALLLNNLSISLTKSGQREQGLAAIQRPVAIFEQLTEQNFAAYAPYLAQGLNNLSVDLAESNQREQGLAAIQCTVAIREQLVEQNFAAYAPALAQSLNILSVYLAESGQSKQGLATIQRAVAIGEQLAEQNFAAYAPDLAKSLVTLSNRLAESGQCEQGLAVSHRAVEINEQLAEQNFVAYAPVQAQSLNNLSNRLAESGQRKPGLATIQRAVVIREQLAKQNFAAYAPDLAQSLANLSSRLAESDQHEQALAMSQRAMEIYEQLAEQNFSAYAPNLASSLNNLSIDLAESGQREQGLATIQRAVMIREQLAKQNFAAYAPDLAQSLDNLSIRLAEKGDTGNAISNCERAIELVTPFAKPGTRYADQQQAMQNNLVRLKGE